MTNLFIRLSPALKGILWMIASTASFSAMIIAVRFLSDTIPPFEQVFLRSVVGLLITLPTVIRTFHKAAHTFRPDKIGGLYISRGLCTFTGVSAWFFAITSLPLSEAVALHFTLPIFGLLLSALILREKVTRHRWVTVASGIIGVLVILRPGIAIFDIMALAVFLSALGYARRHLHQDALPHSTGPTDCTEPKYLAYPVRSDPNRIELAHSCT